MPSVEAAYRVDLETFTEVENMWTVTHQFWVAPGGGANLPPFDYLEDAAKAMAARRESENTNPNATAFRARIYAVDISEIPINESP